MESQLIVEGIGAWKSFDDIEEHLVLDELLLLHESLGKSKHDYFRTMGSFQGVDIGPLESDDDDSDLPEEILQMEREFAAKKAAHLANGGVTPDNDAPKEVQELTGILDGGFGYKKV